MPSALKNPWIIFVVTTFGVCLGAIDAGIVNVALPTITKYFHESINSAQWTVSGYILVICIFLPMSGRLSDLYTKRIIYLLGLVIFTISSFLCGTAFSMASLIIYRLLQGIGSAMMFSNNQAIIVSNFPKNQIGRALGMNATAFALGSVAGPSLGGVLIDFLGWRSIFYINVPIGIATLILGYFLIPRNERRKHEPLDISGFILFALGITPLLLVLGNASAWHWSAFHAGAIIMVALAILTYFTWYERKTLYPMTDLNLFKIPVFRVGNIASIIVYSSIATNSLLLPFCLQDNFGMSPTMVGLFLFIPPLFMMLFSPIVGYYADYISKEKLAMIGLIVISIGMFVEAYIPYANMWWFTAFGQALIGLGAAFFMSSINSSILSNVPSLKLSIATSINSLMRNLGKVIGTCFAVTIFQMVGNLWLGNIHNAGTIYNVSFAATFIMASMLTIIALIFMWRMKS